MSEASKITGAGTPTEEVVAQATEAPVVEKDEQFVADESKIINFFVGIAGSGVYRVSSNVEDLTLRDHIEALATIEINTIASLLESEEASKSIELFLKMKSEILSQAINFLVDESGVEDKEVIKSLFK